MSLEAFEHTETTIPSAQRKGVWLVLLAVAALAVAGLTVWALVLPGATMANQTFCGMQEHQHSGTCYKDVLVCGMQEGDSSSASEAPEGASSSTGEEAEASSSDTLSAAEESSAALASEPATSNDATAGDAVVLSAPTAAHAATSSSGITGHVHTEACYQRQLVCETQEHTHSLACYSDATADVETQEMWEATLPSDDELTGEWAVDVLTVAESQLGYTESSANYVVSENASGTETAKGYSRYGAWYGDAYGDWCAMFVSFCLHYAAVPEEAVPLNANCQNWIETLAAEEVQLWRPMVDGTPIIPEEAADEAEGSMVYAPKPGDLVFFDWDEDGTADHVGIVRELTEATEDEPAKLKTVEGNAWDGTTAADAVCYQEYDQTDASIMGYAEVPENPELQVATTVNVNSITSDKLTTVESASTKDFIELNLYDYESSINSKYNADNKYPGFQWNGGAYMKGDTFTRHVVDYIDFGNSNITDIEYGESETATANGKSKNAKLVGKSDGTNGAINKLDVDDYYGVTNRPIGGSTGDDVLSRTLKDGYPALADGTSLAYLFTGDGSAVKQQNTESIDGLFKYDETTGEYSFDSRKNHAQYANNRFTLYNQIITPNFIVYPFGNFLPFNEITNNKTSTQVSKITNVSDYIEQIQTDMQGDLSGSPTKTQLSAMLEKYQESIKKDGIQTSQQAIVDYFTAGDGDNPSDDTSLISDDLLKKMYNIDWDEETNFFFGMDMTMNFFQPKSGLTGKDGEQPMEFYFTGDDDVWVYIDGVLFLDLSGIHRHVGGKIDFVNGEVHYYYLDTENGGDVSSTPYQTYTFAEILSAAGVSTGVLNNKGTFEDYSTHQFKFYYMERGSGSSVCRMNFNFPLLKQHSISVSKEVEDAKNTLGNPDYQFQVLKADEDGNKTDDLFIAGGKEYIVYDENNVEKRKACTDDNGVFTLKAGERAEFTGIKENAGKYYVRELLSEEIAGAQYTVSGEAAVVVDGVKVNSESFTGVDSPIRNMADGAVQFRFKNTVNDGKLGKLSIKKQIAEYPQTREVKTYFNIKVTLDDKLLPVGTKYEVGEDSRTVETEGIIAIAPDEEAIISGILAGTTFTVQEEEGSAEGYSVTYSGATGSSITMKDGAAQGTVVSNATVGVIVTNNEKGATVTIPGSKELVACDGTEREFTFNLVEVTDKSGSTIKEKGFAAEATCKVKDELENFEFTVNYALLDLGTLPAKRYYRITEEKPACAQENNTAYVVEVTVSEDASAETGAVAEVTCAWKGEMRDGAPSSLILCFNPSGETSVETAFNAKFTNVLIGDLSLSKKVAGEATDKSFTFEVALASRPETLSLPDSYEAELYQAGESECQAVRVVLVEKEGKQVLELAGSDSSKESTPITLKHDERIVVKGLPYGTEWAITETDAGGFVASYEVAAPDKEKVSSEGSEAKAAVSVGEVSVAFTNTQMYRLPDTGGLGVAICVGAGLLFAGLALIGAQMRRRKGEER